MAHLCTSLHITTDDNTFNYKKKFDYKTDLQILNILCKCSEFESISPRYE